MTEKDHSVRQSIEKGIAFLEDRQLPHGEFRMLTALDRSLASPEEDGSVFPTAFAVYSAHFFDHARARSMVAKSLDFLVREMEAPGFWSYWSKTNPKKSPIDLDTTSYVLSVLKLNGVPVAEDKPRLLANQDEQGRFYTWLLNDEMKSEGGHLLDVNPVVNANLLAYLGHFEATDAAARYVVECMDDQAGRVPITYYLDRLFLCYAASRAFYCGVGQLAGARDSVASAIGSRLGSGETWGPMQQALAVCSLINFSLELEQQPFLVKTLVTSQRADGSWPAEAMYYGAGAIYGSEELTTVLCLEALSRSSQPRSRSRSMHLTK
jgi:hypothetical protein